MKCYYLGDKKITEAEAFVSLMMTAARAKRFLP